MLIISKEVKGNQNLMAQCGKSETDSKLRSVWKVISKVLGLLNIYRKSHKRSNNIRKTAALVEVKGHASVSQFFQNTPP